MVSPRPTASNGFTIEVGCPGCGAEIALEQDFRLLTCRHCGSVLRINLPDLPPAFFVRPRKSPQEIRFLLDRHCRENQLPRANASSPIQLTYYPYWKIDAVTLKVRTSVYEVDASSEESPDDGQLEERELTTINLANFSTTLPAASAGASIPYSLGLRTGYLGLVPFIANKMSKEATCLSVTRSSDDAIDAVTKATFAVGRMEQEGSRANGTQLFHPRGSIIYFPYYLLDEFESDGIRRFTIDGVTGRVTGSETLGEASTETTSNNLIRFGALGIEFHRCRNCGVDLPMSQSSVYQCHNCQRVEFLDWHPSLSKQLLIAGSKPDRKASLFPFWMITLQPEGTQKPGRYVVPAFEMRNAETVYRLSSRMSTAIEHIPFEPLEEMITQTVPASRSIESALTLLEILWHRRAAENVVKAKGYDSCRPASIQLLYVPFREEQYFYVDALLKAVTFEKAGALPPVR